MELANSYLEEGFPFRGRKRKKMEQFLEKSGLTYDAQIIYSVLLCRGDGEKMCIRDRDCPASSIAASILPSAPFFSIRLKSVTFP